MARKYSRREKQKIAEDHWSWIWMIVIHTGGGMSLGALTGFLIIHHDIKRIGTMIGKSEYWFGYTFLLMFGFATLFGMIASGAAIWIRAVWPRE